jgi:hypothetical protein
MCGNGGKIWDGKRWVTEEELLEMLREEYGEDFEEIPEDMIDYYDCEDSDIVYMSLDGECIDVILSGFVEEMNYYGDHVTLIAPYDNYIVKIPATVLDNTIRWEIGEDEVLLEAFDYLLENGLIKEVLDVLKTGRWVGIGGYYGYSDYRSTDRWIKVVEGWVGGVSKPGALLEALYGIFNLKVKPDFPILFISARSSSIFARYVYVFVRNEDIERFKKLIPSPSYEDLHSPDYYLNLLV